MSGGGHSDADQRERLAQFERWLDDTGLVVDSDTKYAMHDSLYSNPEQVEAYDEGNELGVDGPTYAIWKLGWDHHVDGWTHDDEFGWRRAGVLAHHQDDDSPSEPEPSQTAIPLSDFGTSEDRTEGASDGAWVYDYGPDGFGRWTNIETGERCRRKRRPGPAPDGGDGDDDWVPGWKRPPESADELATGQLVEVEVSDGEPEVAVVTDTAGDGVRIRTEHAEHPVTGGDSISVLAVEDETDSTDVDPPEWARAFRDG